MCAILLHLVSYSILYRLNIKVNYMFRVQNITLLNSNLSYT